MPILNDAGFLDEKAQLKIEELLSCSEPERFVESNIFPGVWTMEVEHSMVPQKVCDQIALIGCVITTVLVVKVIGSIPLHKHDRDNEVYCGMEIFSGNFLLQNPGDRFCRQIKSWPNVYAIVEQGGSHGFIMDPYRDGCKQPVCFLAIKFEKATA